MINYKIITSFFIGGVTSSFAIYLCLKKKYEEKLKEETEKIRSIYFTENFKESVENSPSIFDDKKEQSNKQTIAIHDHDMISSFNVLKNNTKYYANESEEMNDYIETSSNYRNENLMEDIKKIEEITSEEFGEEFDYDSITLYYYPDGVLADSSDNVIDNASIILVSNYEKKLNESENDAIFVRNHKLKTDFEILKVSDKAYSDILKENPLYG